MADHLDAFDATAETLKEELVEDSPPDLADLPIHSPGADPRVDITDIYAFQKPDDMEAGKSILIMNVNPAAPAFAKAFRDGAVYRLNIGAGGNGVALRSFDVTFSKPALNGSQTAKVQMAVGGGSPTTIFEGAPVSFGAQPLITVEGPFKFFAGLRSDPFFFDLLGFLQGLSFTGKDFFVGLNVFGIVLEVPNRALGANSKIGVWAQTLVDDSIIDQMGRPAINTVFNSGVDKNTFNQTPPDKQPTTLTSAGISFLKSFTNVLSGAPFNNPTNAASLAGILLPDVLTYDFSSSAGFLNGRKLADDVIDAELQLLTGNPAAGDGVGAHTDYLDHFPYLGKPHIM